MTAELYCLTTHWRSYLCDSKYHKSCQTEYVIAHLKLVCWGHCEFALACVIVAASTVLTELQFRLASALCTCAAQDRLLGMIARVVEAWNAYRDAGMLGEYCDTL